MTKPIEKPEGLPELTDKQYKFVLGISEGLNKTEAYRRAYNTATMKPESVWRQAVAVSANVKVAAWLRHIQSQAISECVTEETYTLQTHIKELNRLMEMASESASYGPAINASIAKGKALNLYTEHKQININHSSDLALIEKLKSVLGEQAALNAAESLGYEIPTEDPAKRLN